MVIGTLMLHRESKRGERHPGPPCLTPLCSANPPAGHVACGHSLPFWTPHAVRLCRKVKTEIVNLCLNEGNTFRVKETASDKFMRKLEDRRVFHGVSRDHSQAKS
jgi:hypothetical protein